MWRLDNEGHWRLIKEIKHCEMTSNDISKLPKKKDEVLPRVKISRDWECIGESDEDEDEIDEGLVDPNIEGDFLAIIDELGELIADTVDARDDETLKKMRFHLQKLINLTSLKV